MDANSIGMDYKKKGEKVEFTRSKVTSVELTAAEITARLDEQAKLVEELEARKKEAGSRIKEYKKALKLLE